MTPEERKRLEQGVRDAEAFLDANPHLRGPVLQVAAMMRSCLVNRKNR